MEYAVGPGIRRRDTVKARRIEDIPSRRQALADFRQRELDHFNIDKLPGGNTPENVKIIAQRLCNFEMKLTGAIPAHNEPEWR